MNVTKNKKEMVELINENVAVHFIFGWAFLTTGITFDMAWEFGFIAWLYFSFYFGCLMYLVKNKSSN